MIPWIQVYANLSTHRKTCKLRDSLGLKANYEAVGLLVCLWNWAAVNSPGGNLTGYSPRDIADAVGYRKPPAKLMEALISAGFIDRAEDGTTVIHDWEEHAALLMDSSEQQKKNTRERVRRYRERRKAKELDSVTPSGNGGCNVTGNSCNAPTLPNLTLPNLTDNKNDDDDVSARAKEQIAIYDMIGVRPGEYIGVSMATAEEVQAITSDLILRYWRRPWSAVDCKKVFMYAFALEGRQYIRDQNGLGLLEYAMEQSVLGVGRNNWAYVEGVLNRLAARDIRTREDAYAYDEERPDKEEK